MYTGLLHSHKLLVILFLIHYVVKLLMLQLNKNEALAKYTKFTRIPEMVVSLGFLVTGSIMLVKGAAFTPIMIGKLVCVFASIPLAIIGFKKANKGLALLAVLLIVVAYGLAEMNTAKKVGKVVDTTGISEPLEVGKKIYSEKCVSCHGADGKLGSSGAKDISASQLTADQQKDLIRHGKNSMPPYPQEALTDEQLDAVVQYIGTLKQQ